MPSISDVQSAIDELRIDLDEAVTGEWSPSDIRVQTLVEFADAVLSAQEISIARLAEISSQPLTDHPDNWSINAGEAVRELLAALMWKQWHRTIPYEGEVR